MEMIVKEIGFAFTKEVGEGSNESSDYLVRGKFTDDKVDKHGDIITKAATSGAIEAFKGWRNIRYMHQPRPVGVAVKIGDGEGLAWNELEVKVVKKDVQEEIDAGLLRGFSVGILANWDAIEYNEETDGWIINEYLLGEISLVDHPANYAATIDSIDKSVVKDIASNTGMKKLSDIMEYVKENKMEKQIVNEVPEVEADVSEVEETKDIVEEADAVVNEAVEITNDIVEDEPEAVEEDAEVVEDEVEEPAEFDLGLAIAQLSEVVKSLGETAEKFVYTSDKMIATLENATAVKDVVEEEQSESEEVLEEEVVAEQPEVEEEAGEDVEENLDISDGIDYEKLASLVADNLRNSASVSSERKGVLPTTDDAVVAEEKEAVNEKLTISDVLRKKYIRNQK